MDNLKQSKDFSDKLFAAIGLFEKTNQILEEDATFLSQVREHYSEKEIHDALLQVIEHKNPNFEVELTCDLAAFNDTVDFFENVWSNLSKESIFSKVNEVLIVFNSINFALTQTFRYWYYNYQFF